MAVDDSYTKALLHFDGSDGSPTFTDESGKTWTRSGNAQIDTAQSKFGGASGLFDGTGDYLSTTATPDFDFGTGNFTIDFCFRPTSIGTGYPFIFTTQGTGGYKIGFDNQKSYLGFESSAGIALSANFSNNTWAHVAIVRNGNAIAIAKDGIFGASLDATGDSINTDGTLAVLGRAYTTVNDYYFIGHIDEFRISKGIARWTANFTPPTHAYGVPQVLTPIWFT